MPESLSKHWSGLCLVPSYYCLLIFENFQQQYIIVLPIYEIKKWGKLAVNQKIELNPYIGHISMTISRRLTCQI